MTQHSTDPAASVGYDAGSTVGYDSPNGVASSFAPDFDEPPPPPLLNTRRRKLPVATLVLALLAMGAAGFFIGVKVEKGKVPASTSNASQLAAAAAAFGTGATAARASGSPSTGAAAPTGAAGTGPAGIGGTGPAGTATTSGAANIIGTVTVIDGTTLYVTDTSGNVVKVTTSTGTTVSKTDTATVSALAPGQTVVIRGVQSSAGVYAAQSVSEGAAGAFGGGGFGGRGGRGGAALPGASASAGGN